MRAGNQRQVIRLVEPVILIAALTAPPNAPTIQEQLIALVGRDVSAEGDIPVKREAFPISGDKGWRSKVWTNNPVAWPAPSPPKGFSGTEVSIRIVVDKGTQGLSFRDQLMFVERIQSFSQP